MIPIGRPALALVVIAAACDTGGPSIAERSPAPEIVRVTWDTGAQDTPVADGPVAVWAPVDVWLDQFIDPDSVTSSAARIESNGQVVRATATYDVLDKRVRVTPARDLDPSLAYELVLTEDVRSLAGTRAAEARISFSTGPADQERPPEREAVGWAEAESLITTSCESGTCHGDDESPSTCGGASPWVVAMGLELDDPVEILATAIDVTSRQWPRFARIEPGRPDRSYVTYKIVDFSEEIIVGNIMPTITERGGGAGANGGSSPGACCAVADLPVLHPPPWAEPVGRFDPDNLRRRSLAFRTPAVWECACADTRERFPDPGGPCMVAEGECAGGVDDDGDGLTDCDDADCHFADNCPHERSCEDGLDDDGEGDGADCDDPDCFGAEICESVIAEGSLETVCDDGSDDDGDGAADCLDFDCSFDGDCLTADLQAPDVAAVSYCRGRVVSDWILAGAPVGADRDLCERVCAADCGGAAVSYEDCRTACAEAAFDAEASECARDALCGAFDGPAPRPDGQGRYLLSNGGVTATCEGTTVTHCASDGAGELDPASEACLDLCAPMGDLCTPLSECGLGGS